MRQPASDQISAKLCAEPSARQEGIVQVVAGVDLGGTAINYTLVDAAGEIPDRGSVRASRAFASRGRTICLQQIADGLEIAAEKAGIALADVVAVGLDTPGPASAAGVLSARGSTNFVHPGLGRLRYSRGPGAQLGKPVSYLNDGNAGALWGHFTIFGANSQETSISSDHRHRPWRRRHPRRQCGERQQRISAGNWATC